MATRVSQVNIAEELGLSQRAVSLALNGQSGVSRQTRTRVLDTATRLGYRASSSARATRTGRTGCFALV